VARSMRKVRVGAVVRNSQDKTAIVEMVWKQRHRLYRKQVRRVARFYVHDPENKCVLGDTVRIEETRRISKSKHWRLMAILERKQIAEVRPIDVETDVSQEITQPRIAAAEARAAEDDSSGDTADNAMEASAVEELEVEEPEADDASDEELVAEEEPVEAEEDAEADDSESGDEGEQEEKE